MDNLAAFPRSGNVATLRFELDYALHHIHQNGVGLFQRALLETGPDNRPLQEQYLRLFLLHYPEFRLSLILPRSVRGLDSVRDHFQEYHVLNERLVVDYNFLRAEMGYGPHLSIRTQAGTRGNVGPTERGGSFFAPDFERRTGPS